MRTFLKLILDEDTIDTSKEQTTFKAYLENLETSEESPAALSQLELIIGENGSIDQIYSYAYQISLSRLKPELKKELTFLAIERINHLNLQKSKKLFGVEVRNTLGRVMNTLALRGDVEPICNELMVGDTVNINEYEQVIDFLKKLKAKIQKALDDSTDEGDKTNHQKHLDNLTSLLKSDGNVNIIEIREPENDGTGDDLLVIDHKSLYYGIKRNLFSKAVD